MLPDSEELCCALWGRDGKLDLVLLHGELGVEGALMVHAGVHLNSGGNKLGDLDSHLSRKLNSNRGHEHQFILRTEQVSSNKAGRYEVIHTTITAISNNKCTFTTIVLNYYYEWHLTGCKSLKEQQLKRISVGVFTMVREMRRPPFAPGVKVPDRAKDRGMPDEVGKMNLLSMKM